MLGNFLGILCVVYGALIVYMVTKPEYKRSPKPEDGVLLTGTPEQLYFVYYLSTTYSNFGANMSDNLIFLTFKHYNQ